MTDRYQPRETGATVGDPHAIVGLRVLMACVFVAMIGFGITLPVLPFYTERLVRAGGASPRDVAIQIGLLTAVYPLAQLIVAPLWGRWSDTLGRKRVVLIGVAGAAVGQTLFAFATSLPALYAARVVGGLLTAALAPAAAAYVADATTSATRARGMAWLGTAVSLGVVVGPGLGGLLTRASWQLRTASGQVLVSSFAIPFLAAALLALVALVAAIAWLPAAPPARAGDQAIAPGRPAQAVTAASRARPRTDDATSPPVRLRFFLMLALAGQFGLALFEATFALYGNRMWNYGPPEIGIAFMVCGLVMTVAQLGVTTARAHRILGEFAQVAAGFGLVGASLALLPVMRGRIPVLATVGGLAIGLALITPNLAALISTRSPRGRAGRALGVQGAANSSGQVLGTLTGAALLAWQMEIPYIAAAALMLALSGVVGWRGIAARRRARAVG